MRQYPYRPPNEEPDFGDPDKVLSFEDTLDTNAEDASLSARIGEASELYGEGWHLSNNARDNYFAERYPADERRIIEEATRPINKHSDD